MGLSYGHIAGMVEHPLIAGKRTRFRKSGRAAGNVGRGLIVTEPRKHRVLLEKVWSRRKSNLPSLSFLTGSFT